MISKQDKPFFFLCGLIVGALITYLIVMHDMDNPHHFPQWLLDAGWR